MWTRSTSIPYRSTWAAITGRNGQRKRDRRRAGEDRTVQPAGIHDGLAVYDRGQGEPLLLLPAPHAFTLTPAAAGPLARLLVALDRRVITFDPPGAYRSPRPARVSMAEMLSGAEEALAARGVAGPVDVVGHSMSGLCALALTIERPERVRSLVLVGSPSGVRSVLRHHGMPGNWRITDLDFWRFTLPSLRIQLGLGTLADHKHVLRLMYQASYVDPRHAPPVPIAPGDRHRPAPVRDRWATAVRRLDYSRRLGEIRVPVLICAGRADPQTPLGCAEELARGIPGARLVVFGQSGHYPFVEQRESFSAALRRFWR